MYTILRWKCQVRRRNIHRKFKTKSKNFAAFENLMKQDIRTMFVRRKYVVNALIKQAPGGYFRCVYALALVTDSTYLRAKLTDDQ